MQKELFIVLDRKVQHFFNVDFRSAFFDLILPIFSETIYLVVLLIFFIAAYLIYLKKNGRYKFSRFIQFPAFLGAVVGITNIISDIIKDIASRPRPHQALEGVYYYLDGQWIITAAEHLNLYGSSSFLSSHASNSMAVATVLFFFFDKKYYSIFLLPLMVSWSRMYLGKHYFSDVFAGCVLGFIVAYIFCKMCKKYLFITYKQ